MRLKSLVENKPIDCGSRQESRADQRPYTAQHGAVRLGSNGGSTQSAKRATGHSASLCRESSSTISSHSPMCRKKHKVKIT